MPEGVLFDVPRTPRVVSLRDPAVQARLAAGDPTLVRIDRQTHWGNPFPMRGEGDRERVIHEHAVWLARQHHLIAGLPELAGKDLACWCAPKACHGDVLLVLANRHHINS